MLSLKTYWRWIEIEMSSLIVDVLTDANIYRREATIPTFINSALQGEYGEYSEQTKTKE